MCVQVSERVPGARTLVPCLFLRYLNHINMLVVLIRVAEGCDLLDTSMRSSIDSGACIRRVGSFAHDDG
jgi:hypothetical protein